VRPPSEPALHPTRTRVAVLIVAALVAAWVFVSPSGAVAEDAAEVRARAQKATEELAAAETRLGELEQQISEVTHRTDRARRLLKRLQGQVEQSAVAQYTRPESGDLLGDNADVNDQLRAQALLRIVTQGDVDAIDQYSAVRAEAETAGAALEVLLSEQEDAVGDLQDKADELQAELVRLEELERARREKEAAAARAAEAAQAETASPAPASGGGGGGGGGMQCPVPSATFVDSWGAPRGGGRSHQGVDMMAAHGAPIYAPVSGTMSPNQSSLGGISFYLHGNDGDTYFGSHLSGYAKTGRVSAGDLIGYVGNTGDASATAPHLHFEIHPGGGGAVNPYPRTAAAC
jgi:murein DD-endopeptidase MepM/ murein hydrolase activator NlpD